MATSSGGLAIDPPGHKFAPVAAGKVSESVRFTIKNGNASPVPGLTVAVGMGMDFAIPMGGNRCMATLAPGASCTIEVQFRPGTAGDKLGSLSVRGQPDSTATICLAGTAL